MLYKIILLIGLTGSLFGETPYDRFWYGRDVCYQPFIVNGKIIRDSENSSGGNWIIFDRYAGIKTFLDGFERPLKVLDIGANSGFFSLKIAEDYPQAHCVMIDGTSRLADLCMANTERNNILYLQKYFTIHDLRELVARERFDVILCLHVLHHVDYWDQWLPELKKMGCYIVAEIPPLTDQINQHSHTRALTSHILTSEKFEILGRFPRGKGGPEDYLVLIEGDSLEPPENLGIKSSTFFLFNGQFPTQAFVRERYGDDDTYFLQGIYKR